MSGPHPIILFDGVCNLCNGSVQFVLNRDRAGYFKYASLQSESGQELLKKYGLPTDDYNSFVLVEGERVYTQSTAALRVARNLEGAWKILYGFIIIPAFIRDAVYSLIARNRYRIFGKRESCMLPQPEWKSRFLE
ncbi:MAG: thiol-disulfide oxidoreductase DCC family protein [Saprospiraceae bacterium]|nr:thiol-disulfide oxidoreductase DCC family protein [Saprospiraceae bacterium]MCB9323641.1 thiol-disulfide oxidoreductase DCC family protein [Lewinellaceae bacterium]